MNVRLMRTGEPQYLKNEEIQSIFSKLADYFAENDAKIYFFSFTENYQDSDTEAAKKVIQLMKNKDRTEIIPFNNDTTYVSSMVGKFDYLISQRLHPCILGWVQKVPNIGFEYQFLKTTDFLRSIGMDPFLIRTDEFSLESYIRKYELLKKQRSHIISQSQKNIISYKKKQERFINASLDIMMERRK